MLDGPNQYVEVNTDSVIFAILARSNVELKGAHIHELLLLY